MIVCGAVHVPRGFGHSVQLTLYPYTIQEGCDKSRSIVTVIGINYAILVLTAFIKNLRKYIQEKLI